MIDQGIVDLLANDSGIAAILKNSAAASITGWTAQASVFQSATPEDADAYPCLEYKWIAGNSSNTLDGKSFEKARLEIDCWGRTPTEAKQLAAAVRNAVDNFQGFLSDGTLLQNAVRIHQGIDFFSDQSRYYRVMHEFYLQFTFTS